VGPAPRAQCGDCLNIVLNKEDVHIHSPDFSGGWFFDLGGMLAEQGKEIKAQLAERLIRESCTS
jgi:hypothetical protein